MFITVCRVNAMNLTKCKVGRVQVNSHYFLVTYQHKIW